MDWKSIGSAAMLFHKDQVLERWKRKLQNIGDLLVFMAMFGNYGVASSLRKTCVTIAPISTDHLV
jgi:purine-nucleoside phosphorylase